MIPGYYGTMNIKWLSRLRFEAHETYNYNQIPRYRVPNRPIEPGAEIEYTFENSQPNWQQKIKSVIFSPLEGATLATGQITVTGVAWNDGAAPITAVEVSTDNGQTWQAAELGTHLKAPMLGILLVRGSSWNVVRGVSTPGLPTRSDAPSLLTVPSTGTLPGTSGTGVDFVNVTIG